MRRWPKFGWGQKGTLFHMSPTLLRTPHSLRNRAAGVFFAPRRFRRNGGGHPVSLHVHEPITPRWEVAIATQALRDSMRKSARLVAPSVRVDESSGGHARAESRPCPPIVRHGTERGYRPLFSGLCMRNSVQIVASSQALRVSPTGWSGVWFSKRGRNHGERVTISWMGARG